MKYIAVTSRKSRRFVIIIIIFFISMLVSDVVFAGQNQNRCESIKSFVRVVTCRQQELHMDVMLNDHLSDGSSFAYQWVLNVSDAIAQWYSNYFESSGSAIDYHEGLSFGKDGSLRMPIVNFSISNLSGVMGGMFWKKSERRCYITIVGKAKETIELSACFNSGGAEKNNKLLLKKIISVVEQFH